MRIVAIEVFEFRRGLDGTHFNPATRWDERRAPIVRVTTADGLRGLGEGWCEQARIEAFHAHGAQVLADLPGEDARDIDGILAGLRAFAGAEAWCGAAVAAALELALRDLAAQRAEMPLWRMAGQRARVPVYASGGLYADGKTASDLAAEMAGYAARGFLVVKMKVGALALDADMDRVAAVRAAVGKDVEIIVDAAGRLGLDATAWAKALAGAGVRRIQAPLPDSEIDAMAALQRDTGVAVMAGEMALDPAALAGRIAVVQLNPGLVGFGAALAVPGPVSPMCRATSLLQAAALHLGALERVEQVEVHMFHDHLERNPIILAHILLR